MQRKISFGNFFVFFCLGETLLEKLLKFHPKKKEEMGRANMPVLDVLL